MTKLMFLIPLAMFLCPPGNASGFVLPFSYNENTQGDLSNNPAMPSALADDYLPVFILQGSTVNVDYDIFTIDLRDTGLSLEQLIVEGYSGASVSFIGLQSGPVWTAGLGGAIDPGLLMGWSHFGGVNLGMDLLAPMSTAAGAMGFSPPLEKDVYTILIQDIEPLVEYTLRFETEHTVTPDIDEDGQLTSVDVDALVQQIVAQTNRPAYDFNCDNLVDIQDLHQWLAIAGAAQLPSGQPYLVGDANLDGFVDAADFISWNDHKFTATPAWSKGDFNADGIVDAADFIEWNANKFMSADANAVPEPRAALWLMGLVGFIGSRRRHRKD